MNSRRSVKQGQTVVFWSTLNCRRLLTIVVLVALLLNFTFIMMRKDIRPDCLLARDIKDNLNFDILARNYKINADKVNQKDRLNSDMIGQKDKVNSDTIKEGDKGNALLENKSRANNETRRRHQSVMDTVNKFLSESAHRCLQAQRPRPENIRLISSIWHVHRYDRGFIYIYSSFYDDRPAAGFLPTVRLIVLATFHPSLFSSVYCYLWYESVSEPCVMQAVVNETGMNRYQFNKAGHREYTFTCPLIAADPIPTHVSIATTKQCDVTLTTLVPVQYSHKRTPLFEFGVCVANGYGHTPLIEFVEWMELLRFYGVSEVNLYDTQYENMTHMFNYYKTEGVLSVRQLPHPLVEDEHWYQKVRNLRTVALNDCMLRNMYRYRYLVVIDLDEMIVPKSHCNYSTMLANIDQRLKLTKPSHSYSFRNTYFLKEFSPKKPPESLMTMHYRHRAKPSAWYYGSKSFISPLSCFNLMNHYCYVLLPEYLGGNITVFSPPDIATSHHYRLCSRRCEKLYKEKTADDLMLKVRSRLLKRMQPVLRALYSKHELSL